MSMALIENVRSRRQQASGRTEHQDGLRNGVAKGAGCTKLKLIHENNKTCKEKNKTKTEHSSRLSCEVNV